MTTFQITLTLHSVEDSLPDDDSDVLVFTLDPDLGMGQPMLAWYFKAKGFVPSEVIHNDFEWTKDNHVTHWAYDSSESLVEA